MKVKIHIRQILEIEVNGQKHPGAFQIDSDWNGMHCLKSNGPTCSIIIANIVKPLNTYDRLPKLLGGNIVDGIPIAIEADLVMMSGQLEVHQVKDRPAIPIAAEEP